MNYKELKQIAKEAGIEFKRLPRNLYCEVRLKQLEHLASIIEKRTIERCAVVCEILRDLQIYADKQEAQNDCAVSIRKLGGQ